MPIYEYQCPDCGRTFEEIVLRNEAPKCPDCGGTRPARVLSASSSLSGRERAQTPGSTGHGCCGQRPSDRGCVPGTCCGKA
ncbi:MAG: zinc ribbon domain-containing protein [Desulfovibrionaceae bacterium]|nr:zinc ribbon domain-containing protein [Desulfovibrionaceae bacterium]